MTDLKLMSAAELDALIAAAATERAKREPVVPMEPPKTFEAMVDPRWSITHTHPNTIVQLRSPGHGWVSFVLPPNERAHILSVLMHFSLLVPPPQAQTAAQPPAPPPGPTTGGGTVH